MPRRYATHLRILKEFCTQKVLTTFVVPAFFAASNLKVVYS